MSDIVAPEFKEGELFVYLNGDRWELGMVKRKAEDGKYFCWYSRGDTAARTPVECMHKLTNAGWTHVEGALDKAIPMYTADTLDAMAQRAAEHIEDELVQQILARLGYVKPVRCMECRRASIGGARSYLDEPVLCHRSNCYVRPDGYCAWGVRKEDE